MTQQEEVKKKLKSSKRMDKQANTPKVIAEDNDIAPDTIIFVPLGVTGKTKSSADLSKFQKRFKNSLGNTGQSDNYVNMLRTEKKERMFSKSTSTIDLTSKDQTVIRNGATPDGFIAKEFKVKCGTLSALINHLTSDCSMSLL